MAPTLEASLNTCNQQNIKQLQKRQENTQNLTTNSIKSGHLSAAYHTTLADQNVGPFALMLNRIEAAFNRTDSSVDVDELWRVLEDYKSSPDEWAKFAFYDMTKYKRNLVAEYDKFNVMIICWGPGSRSSIHDHSGSHCFMKVLEGELVESRFAWPDESALKGVQSQEMCLISDTLMKHDQVHYINGKYSLLTFRLFNSLAKLRRNQTNQCLSSLQRQSRPPPGGKPEPQQDRR